MSPGKRPGGKETRRSKACRRVRSQGARKRLRREKTAEGAARSGARARR
jgi:hypothetical protein